MKQIREDIQNGTFKPAYLLYGPEAYLREQYKQMLVRALVPEGETMNFTVYAGDDLEEREIISQAETLPFFAERRVILVEDSGFFKNKADRLADYMKTLPDYLVMIFSESDVDKRSRMYKAVQKAGSVTEFAEQSEDTLMRWAAAKISREGKKIRRSAMQHFMDLTGTDMANISSELEKLLSYCLDKEEITIEDIDAICAPQTTDRVFDMVRAVAGHQQKEALSYYEDLLALKIPPMRILYLMARQYNQLLQIKLLRDEGLPDAMIASKIGVRPFVIRKSANLCRMYSKEQLQKILSDYAKTEEDVKTGRLNDRLSVELMIVGNSN